MTLDTSSPNDSSSPGHHSSTDNQPRREDLRASAEKILYTYLLPGSEREIIIPQSILHDVQDHIEGPEQRSDPELFDQAKDYVFQAMERDAFPGFLQSKGLGNLVPQSMMIRLIIGLISFFGGCLGLVRSHIFERVKDNSMLGMYTLIMLVRYA